VQVYPSVRGAFRLIRHPIQRTRLRRLVNWFDHAIDNGSSGSRWPSLASRTHGYDTTDHYRIDPRLGNDADFDYLVPRRTAAVCVLSTAFNHWLDFPRHLEAASTTPSARFAGRPAVLDRSKPSKPRRTHCLTMTTQVIDYTVDVWRTVGRARRWRLTAYAVPQQFWSATFRRT